MKKTEKPQKKGFFRNWIVRNLLGALLLFTVLIIGTGLMLRVVTRHGQTVTVPDFTNMNIAEAVSAARESGVSVKVTDSVFVQRLSGGVVFRQNPKAGATVKKGRNIFLTINAVIPRKVTMPNLVGYNFLEARAELNAHGLNLGRLQYVSDMATNNVLKQKYRNEEIHPGDEVISGSQIDLVLGLNSSDSRTTVPNVVGMKYLRAVDVIHDRFLNTGRLVFDKDIRTYRDSVNAVVYAQDPAGDVRTMGSQVMLKLTLDEGKVPAK